MDLYPFYGVQVDTLTNLVTLNFHIENIEPCESISFTLPLSYVLGRISFSLSSKSDFSLHGIPICRYGSKVSQIHFIINSLTLYV